MNRPRNEWNGDWGQVKAALQREMSGALAADIGDDAQQVMAQPRKVAAKRPLVSFCA